MNKYLFIFLNALPIILMIALIPGVSNDYLLAALYIVVILGSFKIHYEQKEVLVFLFGFGVMIVSEYFFVMTGVEVFARHSLLGIMPLWLPFLWGYSFVAMKRALGALAI